MTKHGLLLLGSFSEAGGLELWGLPSLVRLRRAPQGDWGGDCRCVWLGTWDPRVREASMVTVGMAWLQEAVFCQGLDLRADGRIKFLLRGSSRCAR